MPGPAVERIEWPTSFLRRVAPWWLVWIGERRIPTSFSAAEAAASIRRVSDVTLRTGSAAQSKAFESDRRHSSSEWA